tara:strand:- start:847 stop:1971 length:1125 start_codon:yes stop_codon:yes gene_type:complete
MKKNILYIVNIDRFFLSHRINIALKAKSLFKVHLATKFDLDKKIFKKKKFLIHDLNINRSSFGLVSNFVTMINILKIMLKVKPYIVHFISIKPVLIGGLVSRLFPSITKIFSISGLGSAFISENIFSKLKFNLLIFLYSVALNQEKCKVIFQNKNDLNFLLNNTKLKKSNCVLIPGSGVPLKKFNPKKFNFKNPIVMFPSRMLAHKGIFEFAQAARILKTKKINARFILVGDIDEDNPSGIKINLIRKWENENILEYWGYKEKMSYILSLATIIVLPSYREGFPKVLMEAAASGRPAITTNVPGCKDAVVHNSTGILVPVKNSRKLANEIKNLLNNKSKIKKMSINARDYALKNFDINRIVDSHIQIYKKIIYK